jgi:hypothetical protein
MPFEGRVDLLRRRHPGVLTGTGTAGELAAVPDATGLAGHPVILDSVAGLLPYLGPELN